MDSADSDFWYLLDSGPGDFAFNMALDEALLECAPELNHPTLRFYGWTQRTASFGYFQRIAQIENLTSLRPLVRRPTGGGLVPHDADWTYSVVIPPSHAWYALHAIESYEQIHRSIQKAFTSLDVPTELASFCRKELPGQCFAGYEKSDVLWLGRKIAGAAQRRTRTGLLIQGSVQPQPTGITRSDWQEAMRRALGGEFRELDLSENVRERTVQLASTKYSRDAYNRRR
jgi:lipoyl(octanoyl) transferase